MPISYLYNMSLILMFILLTSRLMEYFIRKKRKQSFFKWGVAVFSSIIAVLVMMEPFIDKGVRFDLRSIPIFLVSYIWGWKYGVVSAFLPAIYRYYLGGANIYEGIFFDIILIVVIGTAFYNKRKTVSTSLVVTLKETRVIKAYSVYFIIGAVSLLWVEATTIVKLQAIVLYPIFSIITLIIAVMLLNESSRSVYRGTIQYNNLQTFLKKANETIKYQTEHDFLTDLPNLKTLIDDFYYLKRTDKNADKKIAFVLMDLDKFSKINDVLGYNKGDEILKFIVSNIKKHLSHDEILARIGGDNFGVLVKTDNKEVLLQEINVLLRKIKTSSSNIFNVYITTSIGCSLYPDDGDTFKTLYKKADIAMKEAKKTGGDSIRFFESHMAAPTIRHLHILKDLASALETNHEQLLLYFEPQVDPEYDTIIGLESLIRWQHPEMGLMKPGEFIPLAEDSGLIIALDEWVLENACKKANKINNKDRDMRISVNISARQFSRENFDIVVDKILKKTDINPYNLVLEITEHAAIQNINYTFTMLNKLKKLGVKIAIDDFGTGYSSLKYLQKMNVDYIKIDRSFISNLDRNNQIIIKSLIELAHNLGLEVIGEGIETKTQYHFLKDIGCDYLQGYLFHKPVPVSNFNYELKNYV